MSLKLKFLLLAAASLLFSGSVLAAPGSARISKCQDAKGVWHYGDRADEACAESKVTVINQQGVRVKEVAAPLTPAELKAQEARKAAEEQAQRQREEQARRDRQLVATYGHEDDIAIARDRKLADLEGQITIIEATLTSLHATLGRMQASAADEQRRGKPSEQTARDIAQTEAQIAQQEASIAARKKEQAAVKAQYEADLKRYREIRGIPGRPAAVP